LVLGSIIGVPLGRVQMTAVPQRTALSHAFGALCVALVGTAEYYLRAPHVPAFMMGVLSMEVILGSLTFTGSLMAAGKLQEVLPQRPITYKGQNIVNLSLLAVAVGLAVYLVIDPGHTRLFPLMIAIPLVFGVLMIIPIGGADMPTVISLLNSYAGLSAAAMGFVVQSKLLIIAGALDGSSGFILSVIMCKAMNRSFTNVLFGAFGQVQEGGAAKVSAKPVKSATPEDAAQILASARKTSKVLLLHEDTRTGGLGGEIAALISENVFEYLDGPIVRIAAPDTPVPFSPPLEEAFLPNVRTVVEKARWLYRY